jgi:Tfp pilus assembly protein PilO
MNIRPRDRVALVVVLILALLGAYYMLALRPERQKVSALDRSIAAQRQTLAKEQQDYATGRQAQAALKANAADWAALAVAVPQQSDIPALLRTLEGTAHAVNVHMQTISLAGASSGSGAATPSTPAASSPPTTSSGAATSVPIQLTFAGSYNELNRLVQKLDRLVVVSGGKVRATGPLLGISNVSLSGSPKLTVQLTATIYQLAAPTATATKTGG